MSVQNTEAFEAEVNAPAVTESDAFAQTATADIAQDAPATNSNKFYTEEDLARVRSQEKSKLYPELEATKAKLAQLEKEREEEAARRAEAERAEAERLKQLQEQEMDAKSLIDVRTKELQEQLERERQERERFQALLEHEKKFAELQDYKASILEQNREAIIPQLLDLVSGNTPEEIDASVASLKERSQKIFEDVQASQQDSRRNMQGTRVSAPPAGPLETNSENREFTAQDIASMSLNDYAKYRAKLLSPKAQGQSKGFMG